MLKKLTSSFVFFAPPPLFWCTGACILGIITQSQLHQLHMLIFASSVLTLLFLALFYVQKISLHNLITALVAFSSFLFAGWHYEYVIARHTIFYDTFARKSFSCIGTITSLETSNARFKYCFTLKTSSIECEHITSEQSYAIKCYIPYKPRFAIGDSVRIDNLFLKPITNSSFETYLIKEGIVATLFLPKITYTVVYHPLYSLPRSIATTRERVTENILKKMNKQTRTLFSSIFLGTKPSDTRYYESIKEQFSQWGILHYLARSGLHVMLIVLLWSMLLRFVPLPFFVKQSIMLFLILIYHMLTVPSISFIRALITFVLYRICMLGVLPAHPLALLSGTTFMVLMYNPLEIFFLDFQLSFALTTALAWFNELAICHKRDQTIDPTSQNALN